MAAVTEKVTFDQNLKFENHSLVSVIRVIVTGKKNSHRLSSAVKEVEYKWTKLRYCVNFVNL